MARRVTAMASDPIVEEIVGVMVAKITDDQKALLIAAFARASGIPIVATKLHV